MSAPTRLSGATGLRFRVDADASASEWLQRHPSSTPRVLAYDVHRCCGGGKICQARIRSLSEKDDPDAFAIGSLVDGSTLLIDRRAATRLPSRFGLTVRGLGPLRHLDLELEADAWGELLYT